MVKPYEGNKPYIFVSYSAADSEIAYSIIEEFSGRHYRVWYDAQHAVNDDAVNALTEKIRNCAFFLCVLSEAYTNDLNCKSEIYFALNSRKTVLPIKTGNFQLPETVRFSLATTNWLYLSHFESVSEMIDRICGVNDQRLRACLDRPVRKGGTENGFI